MIVKFVRIANVKKDQIILLASNAQANSLKVHLTQNCMIHHDDMKKLRVEISMEKLYKLTDSFTIR